jgi:carbonic anhydrase
MLRAAKDEQGGHMSEGSNLSRRGFIASAAAGTTGLAMGSSAAMAASNGPQFPHPKTPDQAIALLKQGNGRYAKGKLELRDYSPVGERVASAQQPFAAIITCADSRISPTLVFDIHRGNLFVSRIAGNTVDPGTLGSTEYAVGVLGVKVVLVLGHSNCGAVKAAIDVANGKARFPRNKFGQIGYFVNLIVPTANSIPRSRRTVPSVTIANARTQARMLASKGPIIAPAVRSGKIKVISGVYDIATGRVNF